MCVTKGRLVLSLVTYAGLYSTPALWDTPKEYIVQWNRGRWGNDLTDMAKADAIEIQVGQGAEGSLGTRVKADDIRADSRAHLGLKPGEDATRPARFRDITHPMQFRDQVDTLRNASSGVPIGLKFAAAMSSASKKYSLAARMS
jgi:glutamate synthase domain-containing protein 2